MEGGPGRLRIVQYLVGRVLYNEAAKARALFKRARPSDFSCACKTSHWLRELAGILIVATTLPGNWWLLLDDKSRPCISCSLRTFCARRVLWRRSGAGHLAQGSYSARAKSCTGCQGHESDLMPSGGLHDQEKLSSSCFTELDPKSIVQEMGDSAGAGTD